MTLADAAEIERAVREHHVRLVVVDVLMAYLPTGVDSHRDQDVRTVLAQLAAMADRCHCCVVLLRHLTKAHGGNPIYAGDGSIGIAGAARAALLAGLDPDDDMPLHERNIGRRCRDVVDDRHGSVCIVQQDHFYVDGHAPYPHRVLSIRAVRRGWPYNIEPGYNSGSSINLGSATFVGQPNSIGGITSTSQSSAQSEATALLTPGTWTVFAGLGRISGGSATDQADTFYLAVYDVGDS